MADSDFFDFPYSLAQGGRSHAFRVSEVKFEDYSQVTAVGLRNEQRSWQVTVGPKSRALIQEASHFLSTRKGVFKFRFLDPDTGEVVFVRCAGFRVRHSGKMHETLTADFVEVASLL